MRRCWSAGIGAALVLAVFAVASAHAADSKLPAGPIRDRHHLMEGIGKNAKTIGDAMKVSNFAPVGGAAEAIAADAAKVVSLFPPGSTDPHSRAKPEIWQDWSKFEAGADRMQKNAAALATTAKDGGDVRAAAKALFDTCKGCHDQFRVPEKNKPA